MSFRLTNKELNSKLTRHLENQREKRSDIMEKLSSGQVFTSKDPRPAQRAISEQMEFRLRSLASSKNNINDAVSLLQIAESGLSEINNIIVRMKELNLASATTTVSDQDRRYLFIEYEGLYNELNRIAITTEFNGLPILNGESDKIPEELIFRVDDPKSSEDGGDDDINTIKFGGLKSVVATTSGLGLTSAMEALSDTTEVDGLSLEEVTEFLEPQEEEFATVYDEALNRLSTQRAVFGAMQSRLNVTMNYLDVYQENIAAAKSKISDTDYAQEVVKLTETNILMQATTGLLAQNSMDSHVILNLLASLK